ncbi:MAG: hypothetical protein NTX03_03600 [Bacteroidetes bacterium]|nr:hypothetical protein [Bacteroidota bacterium]
MKKNLTAILLILLFAGKIFSQSQKNLTILYENRIYLKEKKNLPLKSISPYLLSLYAKGELQGFKPNNYTQPLGFFAFLEMCKLPLPSWATNSTLPPCLECMDEELKKYTEGLTYAFDYIEKPEKSNGEGTIAYLRLVYKDAAGNVYPGPVFKYADVLALGNDLKIKNPENESVNFSIKDIFSIRNFQAKALKHNGWDDSYEKQIRSPYDTDNNHGE